MTKGGEMKGKRFRKGTVKALIFEKMNKGMREDRIVDAVRKEFAQYQTVLKGEAGIRDIKRQMSIVKKTK